MPFDWTQVSGTTQLVGPAKSTINGGDSDCASLVLLSNVPFPPQLIATLTTNYGSPMPGIGVSLWIRAMMPGLNNFVNANPWGFTLNGTNLPVQQSFTISPGAKGLVIIQSVPNSGDNPDVYQSVSYTQTSSGITITFSNPCGAHSSSDNVVIVLSDVQLTR
jgi:hypothetical protein